MHVQLPELPKIDRCDVGHRPVRGSLLAVVGGGSGGSGGPCAVGVLGWSYQLPLLVAAKVLVPIEPKSNTAVL